MNLTILDQFFGLTERPNHASFNLILSLVVGGVGGIAALSYLYWSTQTDMTLITFLNATDEEEQAKYAMQLNNAYPFCINITSTPEQLSPLEIVLHKEYMTHVNTLLKTCCLDDYTDTAIKRILRLANVRGHYEVTKCFFVAIMASIERSARFLHKDNLDDIGFDQKIYAYLLTEPTLFAAMARPLKLSYKEPAAWTMNFISNTLDALAYKKKRFYLANSGTVFDITDTKTANLYIQFISYLLYEKTAETNRFINILLDIPIIGRMSIATNHFLHRALTTGNVTIAQHLLDLHAEYDSQNKYDITMQEQAHALGISMHDTLISNTPSARCMQTSPKCVFFLSDLHQEEPVPTKEVSLVL